MRFVGLLVMVLCGALMCAGRETESAYPTGCLVSPPDDQGKPAEPMRVVRSPRRSSRTGQVLALPAACKNYLYLPKVRSQLLGNCGAYAPSYYYKTYQEAREHGWVRPDPDVDPQHVMSPGFTFPLTNYGKNDGASIGAVMQVICRYGIATWEDMPESPRWWEYPSDDVWAKALPYRGQEVFAFDTSTDDGILALKQHLADGDLACMSVLLYWDTHDTYPNGTGIDNDVIYGHGTNIWDNHAFTLIGYDDTKAYNDGTGPKTGAFLAVNSWGGWGIVDPDVGTGGFCWFGYDYVKSGRGGLAGGALAMTDRIGYVPQELAEVEVFTDSRRQLQMWIRGGGETADALEAFPRHGGDLAYYGRLTLDVTDFISSDPCVYNLYVVDNLLRPVPGSLQDFRVRKAEGYTIPCDELPVSLPVGGHRTLVAGLLDEHTTTLSGIGVLYASADWADMDGDGDLDLAVGGTSASSEPIMSVYRNIGNGEFSAVDIPVTNLDSVVVRWGDYDRDGYPDLAVAGRWWEGFTQHPFSAVFRNELGRSFSTNPLVLPVQVGTGVDMAWGDVDNDGAPDLALCGYATGGSRTHLLLNTGTNFVVSPASFEQVHGKPVSWADVDNDGWLDLTVGRNIYLNRGIGGFETKEDALPETTCHAWGDFNRDGLLDVVCYRTGSKARLCLNNGYYYRQAEPDFGITEAWIPWFLQQDVDIPVGGEGRLAAADFDFDGDLDLAYSVRCGPDYSVQTAGVARAETDGSYADIGLRIPGIVEGELLWGDWDQDRDLDLIVVGKGETVAPTDPYGVSVARCYQSLMGDNPGHVTPNNAPSPPSRFSAAFTNDSVLLQWSGADDTETPSRGLSYDVRVGTRPGDQNVVSTAGRHTLQGRARTLAPLDFPAAPTPYQQFFNTNGAPGLIVADLQPGRYYWSVRTRDEGLAVSPWSREQCLSVSSAGLRTGDVNNDGRVDVADVVSCRKMVRGSTPVDLVRADMDTDGQLTETDANLLIRMIMGTEGADYLLVAAAVIGPAGGSLDAPDFQVVVPSGAFDEAMALELRVSEDDLPFGAYSPPAMYMIHNLPSTFNVPIQLKIPDTRADPADVSVAFMGRYALSYDHGDDRVRVFSGREAVRNAEGKLVVELEAPPTPAATPSGRATGPVPPPEDSFGVKNWDCYISWDTTKWVVQRGTHFDVYYSLATPGNQSRFFDTVNTVMQTLDSLRTRYQGMGFDMGRLPSKVPIWVYDLGKNAKGELNACSATPYEIELHSEAGIVENAATLKATLAHELLHLVQWSYGASYYGWKTLWLDEATSVWAENLDVFLSTTYNANWAAAFKGMRFSTWEARKTRQDYGYGSAGLIAHLVKLQDERILRTFYSSVLLGMGSFEAINRTMHERKSYWPDWHRSFYPELLKDTICTANPSSLTRIVDPKHVFTVQSDKDRAASFTGSVGGFGADLYRVIVHPQYKGLEDDDVLAFKLKGDEKLWLTLLTAYKNNVNDTVIQGAMTRSGVYRAVLPDLKALAEGGQGAFSGLGLVVRSDKEALESRAPCTMDVGVIKALDGDLPLLTHVSTNDSYVLNFDPIGFPAFNCQGHLTVTDLPGLYDTGLYMLSPVTQFQWVYLTPWADGRVPFRLTFTATLQSTQYDMPTGGSAFTRYSVSGVSGYKMTKRRRLGPSLDQQPIIFEDRPFTSGMELELAEDEEDVYYLINVVFDLTMQDYVGPGNPWGNPTTFTIFSTPLLLNLNRR